MKSKNPRILFFIGSSMPNEKEIAEAKTLGSNVAFRNAGFVADNEAPEECDGVAGKVPKVYKEKAKAKDVIEAYEKSLEVKPSKVKTEAEIKAEKEAKEKAKADAKAEKEAKAAKAKAEKEADKEQTEPPAEGSEGWKPNV